MFLFRLYVMLPGNTLLRYQPFPCWALILINDQRTMGWL